MEELLKILNIEIKENKKQQDKINKAIEYIEKQIKHCELEKQNYEMCNIQNKFQKELLKILI